VKTASFFTYSGPGRISIARWEPRDIPPGYRRYKPLAPRATMLRMPYGRYRALYVRSILGRLDPRQVVKDLHRLADPHEPVLLCWERPPLTRAHYCHRRMVAEWLSLTLGLDVPELERAAAPSTQCVDRLGQGVPDRSLSARTIG
jgi:hypothetical protein